MFLKLEEDAEERQTVVRCGGANQGPVFPVATSVFEEAVTWRDPPEVQRAGEVWACIVMKRAHADAAAGKESILVHPIPTVHCLLFLLLVESV